jgi:hypothetical protein
MASPRDIRRAAQLLLSLESRLERARRVPRADFMFAYGLARAESADRSAATTAIDSLGARAPSPAEVASLRGRDFTTVLDIATASIAQLALVPGIDIGRARTIRAAARAARAQIASEAIPRLIADDPTAAQTQLVRLICGRVVVDRFAGTYRDDVVTFARAARQLPRERGSGAAGLQALVAPYVESGLAENLITALEQARAAKPRGRAVWEDFRDHPGEYYTVIEALAGGPRRSARSYGAIPDGLAAAIAAQPLDLSLFRSTLLPFQAFGARFALFQGRVVLGDESGLGKAAQCIAVMAHLAAGGERWVLVIAPPGRHDHWERRVRNLSSLVPTRVGGPRPASALSEWRAVGGVAIGSDDVLGLVGSFGTDGIALLVIDEAHHLADADPTARRRMTDVINRADRVILLTGRTLGASPAGVVALARMARPDLATQLPEHPDKRRLGALRARLAAVYLARTARDVDPELRAQAVR